MRHARASLTLVALVAVLAGCGNTSAPTTSGPDTTHPSTPASTSDLISPQAGTTSFANPQPSTDDTNTNSFTWNDPTGYKFQITVTFGTPAITDPVANCPGGDAPPDTVNIPFTMTVTNLLPDRSTSLPVLQQNLTGLTPDPHPGGGNAQISETDGTHCDATLYGLAGEEQTTGTIPAGGSITIQGIAYAIPTPITGTMTFNTLSTSTPPIASIPLPTN